MILLGYARVSKGEKVQSLDLQLDALAAAGVAPERIYTDYASGKREDRPGLLACLKALQPGNALVVWKLDRLGRDLRHLVNTVHDLTPTVSLGITYAVVCTYGCDDGRKVFQIC